MQKTQKKYWINGHQIRGKNFHTITLSLFNYGIMFVFGSVLNKTITSYFNFYQLTK